MSFLSQIAEGGQTWAHRVRMLRQVLRINICCSFAVAALFFGYMMSKYDTEYYQCIWYYAKANTVGLVNDVVVVEKEFWSTVAREHHSRNPIISANRVIQETEKSVIYMRSQAYKQMVISGKYALFTFLGIFVFFFLRGQISKKKKHISGKERISSRMLSWKMKLGREASDIKIGSIPMLKDAETQHTLVSGGTGSGKTNCFHHILPTIFKNKQKAIIVDTTGAFVDRYYREGKDIILNPFDQRTELWNPWAECREKYDFNTIAESFIPQPEHENEKFWRDGARSIFSSLLEKEDNVRDIESLENLILRSPLEELHSKLKGTKASTYVDPNSERTASSIRSVASSFLDSLSLLKNTTTPFSIRDWIEKEEEGCLFLSSSTAQRAALTPLLSAWFSIAMRGLMNLEPSRERRIWFICDELPSLHKLKDLETFVVESRKFGGCGLFAIQSPSQIEKIYGRHSAQTIIGNCKTKVVFSEDDPEVATRLSKMFGEKEVKEYQEGISYGSHQMRDGVNISQQTKSKPVISSTDIQSLQKNQAFVKLPGAIPITKIKFKIAK